MMLFAPADKQTLQNVLCAFVFHCVVKHFILLYSYVSFLLQSAQCALMSMCHFSAVHISVEIR